VIADRVVGLLLRRVDSSHTLAEMEECRIEDFLLCLGVQVQKGDEPFPDCRQIVDVTAVDLF
jgi:hypothetical protein